MTLFKWHNGNFHWNKAFWSLSIPMQILRRRFIFFKISLCFVASFVHLNNIMIFFSKKHFHLSLLSSFSFWLSLVIRNIYDLNKVMRKIRSGIDKREELVIQNKKDACEGLPKIEFLSSNIFIICCFVYESGIWSKLILENVCNSIMHW